MSTDGDTETGTPTVWDNGWREGHAHGVASSLGIPYREGWLRTMRMLNGEPLDTSHLMSGEQRRNDQGEWVPDIPVPLFGVRKRCKCGQKFWTLAGYRGHALVHILRTP